MTSGIANDTTADGKRVAKEFEKVQARTTTTRSPSSACSIPQAYDLADLYQLNAAGTRESLYTSFNGDEYDTLEGILNGLS